LGIPSTLQEGHPKPKCGQLSCQRPIEALGVIDIEVTSLGNKNGKD